MTTSKHLSRLIIVLSLGLMASCTTGLPTKTIGDARIVVRGTAYETPTPAPTETPTPDPQSEYPGVTIDQIFPLVSYSSFNDKTGVDTTRLINALGYDLEIKGFAPIAIKKESRTLFRFKTLFSDEYHETVVGRSHLLGPQSNEIYVAAVGPGAVCCTNYWIVDVTSSKPRLIFQGEEHGRFRDAIEIFDQDGDGMYELAQSDSCFRYFMERCGTCSPEPKAAFKYDPKRGRYLPARGVRQDFVKAWMTRAENKVKTQYKALQQKPDPSVEFEMNDQVLELFVQMLHIGEEKDGWAFFRKYYSDQTPELMKEIKWRLKKCEFYQALRK